MDGDDSKIIVGCEGVKVYEGDWTDTNCTDNQQPTQTREIRDSRERSTVAKRGTAKLLDSSVGVEVTSQTFSRDCSPPVQLKPTLPAYGSNQSKTEQHLAAQKRSFLAALAHPTRFKEICLDFRPVVFHSHVRDITVLTS